MHKYRLFTPGPTPVPDEVLSVLSQPMIHHRYDEFQEIFKNINSKLSYLFQTETNVLTLTGSGTAAMEAIVANFTDKSNVLIVSAGKFGERWLHINKLYSNNTFVLEKEYGESVESNEILDFLKKNKEIDYLFLTHSETSTGAYTDIKEIAKSVSGFNSNIKIIVDGITAISAHEMRFDEWGIDCVATGSQKGLMLPPGLSFIAVSKRMWDIHNNKQSYYLNLKLAAENLKKNLTPFTPAVGLIVALQKALELIEREGIENVWARHEKLSRACREAVCCLGLELFAVKPSFALTSVKIPSKFSNVFDDFLRKFKAETGITLAAGHGELKGKIFRISHLGYYDEFDIITVISALEKFLYKNKCIKSLGAGTTAAMNVLFK
jgi:serine---pyruvate transaminase